MKYIKFIDIKGLGKIGIIEENGFIIELTINKLKGKEYIESNTKLLVEAEKQIKEYVTNKRKLFDLPLNPKGTEFMRLVWKELMKIPYGETRTYKQIAENIGNPRAARAVGMANNKNPIPILIPCHRVIGANGKLIGYALGLEKKQFLLNLEGKG